jgi:bifunctional aspartokinase / homoserine dehydrogenase 1
VQQQQQHFDSDTMTEEPSTATTTTTTTTTTADAPATTTTDAILIDNDKDNNNNNNNNNTIMPLLGFMQQECCWQVHKFGGTSVANADCFRLVADIVEHELELNLTTSSSSSSNNNNHNSNNNINTHGAIVVSAMGGKPKTTDLLLETVRLAAARQDVEPTLQFILSKHTECCHNLFSTSTTTSTGNEDNENNENEHDDNNIVGNTIIDIIAQDLHDIRDILKTVALMKWQASRISELVSGYGELWSTQILCALLQQRERQRQQQRQQQLQAAAAAAVAVAVATNGTTIVHHEFVYLDARRVIVVDEEAIQGGAIVWDASLANLKQVQADECQRIAAAAASSSSSSSSSNNNNKTTPTTVLLHYVMTGYVASNTHGVATTLQRDGSDYSAAILGRLLQAASITIWTDVDGVLSADPRRVPLAQVLSHVSYNEAMELGAWVFLFLFLRLYPRECQICWNVILRQALFSSFLACLPTQLSLFFLVFTRAWTRTNKHINYLQTKKNQPILVPR